MPNTKSAERRVRSNAAKQARNTSVKSRLKTLERRLNDAVKEGNKDTVKTTLINVTSAFDKAAKGGTIHKATADRKKSRLSLRANSVK
jgi:small subunit ribosomal protein S20